MSKTAIWFDLDGTLIEYTTSFEAMLEIALGCDLQPPIHETFRQQLFAAFESHETRPYRQAFGALIDECNLEINPDSVTEDFHDIEIEATQLVPGARAVLRQCKTLGAVGLLTNGSGPMQRGKLAKHDLEDRFDAIIISNEVGHRKPSTAIFDLARERLSAQEHLYVGDSYETDIAPAQTAGFAAVHVRHDDGPALSVNQLTALETLLSIPGEVDFSDETPTEDT